MKKLYLMRNSKGEHDGTWSFAVISFIIVTIIVICSMFNHIAIWGFSITFNEPNIGLITLYFGGAFTSYILRRNSKDKTDTSNVKPEEVQPKP